MNTKEEFEYRPEETEGDILTKNKGDNENSEQQAKILANIRYEQDTKHRKFLMYWMVAMNTLWVVFVLIMVVLGGAKCLQWEGAVFCTLLGTTTANVLGLAYIILKGLFNKNNPI